MAQRKLTAAIAFVSLGLLAACPDKPTEDPKPPETGKTVTAERYIKATPEMLKRGKAAFGACMGCHGEKAEGRIGIGPRLASKTFLEASSDIFLVNTIKNGRAGTTMTAWGTSYSNQQIESVVAYIRSLQPSDPGTLNEGPLAGDPVEGEGHYRAICATCHGRNGGGYMETSNGTGIGRKVFLDGATDGFIRYIANSGKSHTKMRGFGEKDPMAVANLTEKQVDDVIAHLRKNAW
jgi:cytochrome c oxidase cbb3-type subunit 3